MDDLSTAPAPGSVERRPRRLVASLLVVAVVLAGAGVAAWVFQPWRLWTTTVVAEAAPGAVPAPAGTPTAGAPAPATRASGSPSAAGPQVVAAGDLDSLAHETTGRVTLVALPDGGHAVRIEDLATSDGPDLRVWLSARTVADVEDAESGRWLELGPLRGNRGALTYPVPAGTDVSEFASLVIWCKRFSVGFGAAPLTVA
ncbi:DM13 domain-containing protein [Kineosporia sp. A_224]|uniref:DM13 domain-containing protein n=1 Tax=Kineosporia sp. A_224 TaxID=1962180 RepID=UPI0018E9AED4|nr:DM13 domain-containing protein [Kineosporia sp. A_224]